jgi:hypothetical protein
VMIAGFIKLPLIPICWNLVVLVPLYSRNFQRNVNFCFGHSKVIKPFGFRVDSHKTVTNNFSHSYGGISHWNAGQDLKQQITWCRQINQSEAGHPSTVAAVTLQQLSLSKVTSLPAPLATSYDLWCIS